MISPGLLSPRSGVTPLHGFHHSGNRLQNTTDKAFKEKLILSIAYTAVEAQ